MVKKTIKAKFSKYRTYYGIFACKIQSVMKTVQKPTVFRKSLIFVNCLRFSLKPLSKFSQKVKKNIIFRWKRSQIKQN